MKVNFGKKIIVFVCFSMMLLCYTMTGFASGIESVIYVDDIKANLTNELYTINDEVMISIKDLSDILDVELYSNSDKSSHIGGIYITLGENTFKNKGVITRSTNKVTKMNEVIYVPLKAVSNALICEVIKSNNELRLKKLRPTENENLKLIYDTRISGKILSYEWIKNIDCSYNNEFSDIPIESIDVVVIKEIVTTHNKKMGLISEAEKWSSELYVNSSNKSYRLDESYRHIDLKEGKNTLQFHNKIVDLQSNMLYEIVELPEFNNVKDTKEAIKKVMTDNTKISFFMINGFNRDTPQVLKIESIKGYEDIFIVVSTIVGQDIIIDNPDNVSIKGILLSHSGSSRDQLGEHRLIAYDETIPVFYMDSLETLSSYHSREIDLYLKGDESEKIPRCFYDMNNDIVELFSRNIDSLSIEKDNVAVLGEYIDIEDVIESINDYYIKEKKEYDAAKEVYYLEKEKKLDAETKVLNETFAKIPTTLKTGKNAFCGYYLENKENSEVVELGEFSLNHHIKRIIPMKLPTVTSGILYFKGEMTFDKNTIKLLNHGRKLNNFEIYIDGLKTYDGYTEKDSLTEFPEGTHRVEIYYMSESDKNRIGNNIGISTPYESRHYKSDVDLSIELSNGTQVYYIESMNLDNEIDTTIDLKNYSGRIGLILKSGYYGNWKIINDDKVDITFVILNNGLQSNINLEQNNSTRIIAISDDNDEFINNFNIGLLKAEMHYTELDYLDNLDIYDKTKNKVEIFVDNKKVNINDYEYVPILLKSYSRRKSVPMISLEVLADVLDCKYSYDEELGTINISKVQQKLVFEIENKTWEGNNGRLTSLAGAVEEYSGHYYVDFSKIAYEFSYYLKWYVDEDRLMLTSQSLTPEKLDANDSIPDNGFRVYEFNGYNEENKYVKTYSITDIKELSGSGFLLHIPNMLLVQKLHVPEQQSYFVDIGNSLLSESRIEVNDKEYGFKESFILPKGEQIINYYWYQKNPSTLELKVK